MRKKRAKAIRALAFDIYRNDSDGHKSHTNVYRLMKRFYTNSISPKSVAFRAIQLTANPAPTVKGGILSLI
jgi:hypothetical protein